jgi:hypothetical protein
MNTFQQPGGDASNDACDRDVTGRSAIGIADGRPAGCRMSVHVSGSRATLISLVDVAGNHQVLAAPAAPVGWRSSRRPHEVSRSIIRRPGQNPVKHGIPGFKVKFNTAAESAISII